MIYSAIRKAVIQERLENLKLPGALKAEHSCNFGHSGHSSNMTFVVKMFATTYKEWTQVCAVIIKFLNYTYQSSSCVTPVLYPIAQQCANRTRIVLSALAINAVSFNVNSQLVYQDMMAGN